MSNKIEYQGVMIRAIAQIIDNAILFSGYNSGSKIGQKTKVRR